MEKEARIQEETLRKNFLTEDAHRIKVQLRELKEQALELKITSGLEGYIRYFYEEKELHSLLSLLPERH